MVAEYSCILCKAREYQNIDILLNESCPVWEINCSDNPFPPISHLIFWLLITLPSLKSTGGRGTGFRALCCNLRDRENTFPQVEYPLILLQCLNRDCEKENVNQDCLIYAVQSSRRWRSYILHPCKPKDAKRIEYTTVKRLYANRS